MTHKPLITTLTNTTDMTQSGTDLGTANPLFVGSIPTRASNFGGAENLHNETINKTFCLRSIKLTYKRGLVSYPIELNLDKSGKLRLSFVHNEAKIIVPLNCSLSEISEEDVFRIVDKEIRNRDNLKTIEDLGNDLLSSNETGGALDHRKKCFQGLKWFFREAGLSLDSETKILLNVDADGYTLPEQWEQFGKPHKLRQVCAIFSRKNLKVYKRLGYDVSHFGNFATYVAETTTSTPFTTSDEEVEKIINHFDSVKEDHPVFYKIYLLAFGCGLRKSEIYQVKFEHFTTFNGQCFLQLPFATKRSRLKGTTHIEKCGISKQVYNFFTALGCGDEFVVEGGNRLHKRFVRYLKNEVGIQENKACHRLRKILGARLATEHGIYHASKQLRNSVGVCERYYSDLVSHRNDLHV